ncbi:hypothetical protein [Arthrobacter monumenti]
MRQFWWATQSDNYGRVEGTPWTNFFDSQGKRRPGSAALASTKPGDIVFHCQERYIRAVSEVVSEPTVVYRPEAYKDYQTGSENDEGYLVLVRPLKTNLQIDRRTDMPFIEFGGAGPLNKNGGLKRGQYLSPLPVSSAEVLLRLAGMQISALPEVAADEYLEPFSGIGLTETDRIGLAKRRLEQRYLRSVLLNEAAAQCAICHRELPDDLLVAGHIKPRWACTESERKDFTSVAMLICLVGCDSFYERGMISVNEAGEIVRTSHSDSTELDSLLDAITGNKCLRYNSRTAAHFQWHYNNTFAG